MKSFCRNFFKYDQEEPHDIDDCPQCKEAYDEEVRFNRIEQEVVDGPLYHRTDLEKAALDHNGRP